MSTDNLILKVLKTWPGTPETLGEALHDALQCPVAFPKTTEDRVRLEIASARRRIGECPGGHELLMAEQYARLGRK